MSRKEIAPNSNISIRLPKAVDSTILEWIGAQSKLNTSILKLIENEILRSGIKDLTPEDPVPKIKDMLDLIFNCIRDNYKNGKLQTEVSDIYKYIKKNLGVSDQIINIPTQSNKSKFKNRCRFGILTLVKYGLIENEGQNGEYSLSAIGEYYLNRTFKFEMYKSDLQANFVNQRIKKENI